MEKGCQQFYNLRTVKAYEPLQAEDIRTVGQTNKLQAIPADYIGKRPIDVHGNQDFYRKNQTKTR